jgi:hypothetical protein
LPKRLEINGKIFDIAVIDRPEQPYIILESLSKEKKVSKGIYLIKSLSEETIKLVEYRKRNILTREEGINVTSGFLIFQCRECTLSLNMKMAISTLQTTIANSELW